MIKIRILLCLIALVTLLSAACNSGSSTVNMPNINRAADSNQLKADNTKPSKTGETPPAQNTVIKTGAGACVEQKQAGKRFIKSQTFPFNFKPFEGSCFVTFGNVEDMLNEKDIPRGSTFYIYKDGKQTFEFPDAFSGQPACWIEGVAFKDLNGDSLTDVVLAGSCLAAKDSYPANAVYVNTGSTFTTSDDANSKLENLRSVKDIETFVKKNVKLFF